MSSMHPAIGMSALMSPPPLPPARITPKRLAFVQRQKEMELDWLLLSFPMMCALTAGCWRYVGYCAAAICFEKPGHWLEINKANGQWRASILPSFYLVPRLELGDAGWKNRFPEAMYPPVFSGWGGESASR